MNEFKESDCCAKCCIDKIGEELFQSFGIGYRSSDRKTRDALMFGMAVASNKADAKYIKLSFFGTPVCAVARNVMLDVGRRRFLGFQKFFLSARGCYSERDYRN